MATKRKFMDHNCQNCDKHDNYDDMVCCGKCNKWTHFRCAGVEWPDDTIKYFIKKKKTSKLFGL